MRADDFMRHTEELIKSRVSLPTILRLEAKVGEVGGREETAKNPCRS